MTVDNTAAMSTGALGGGEDYHPRASGLKLELVLAEVCDCSVKRLDDNFVQRTFVCRRLRIKKSETDAFTMTIIFLTELV